MTKRICFLLAAILVCVMALPAGAINLRECTGFMNYKTGQFTVTLGYDTGLIEFRDFTGKLLASRSGLGVITAMDNNHTKTSEIPKLWIGSADGTLRMINPVTIGTDIRTRKFAGTITEVECWDDCMFVGVTDSLGRGTLYVLNNETLGTMSAYGGFGTIQFIKDSEWETGGYGDGIIVASSEANGTLRLYQTSYTASAVTLTLKTKRTNIGTIKGMSYCEDLNYDGNYETAVSTTANGGSFIVVRPPSLTTVATRTNLGTPGIIDIGEEVDLAGNPLIIMGFGGGVARTFSVNDNGNGTFTCPTLSTRTGLGNILVVGFDEIYGHDDMSIIVSTDGAKAAFHITGANLTPDLTYFKIP